METGKFTSTLNSVWRCSPHVAQVNFRKYCYPQRLTQGRQPS